MNILNVALGAIIIAFSPILTKAVNLPPTMIGFYRFFFGSISLGLIYLFSKRENNPQGFKQALPYYFISGCVFSLDLWFWHRSIINIGAGIATLLANSQTFYLIIIGRIIFKDKFGKLFIPAMLLAIIGMGMVSISQMNLSTNEKTIEGIIFGLLTGISYAIVTISLKKASSFNPTGKIVGILTITIIATMTSLITVLLEENFQIGRNEDLFYMFIYGAIVHSLGWYLISNSINKIPIGLTSLLLLLQPLLATLMGAFIYQEALSSYQKLGLVLSLIGIYLASVSKSEKS